MRFSTKDYKQAKKYTKKYPQKSIILNIELKSAIKLLRVYRTIAKQSPSKANKAKVVELELKVEDIAQVINSEKNNSTVFRLKSRKNTVRTVKKFKRGDPPGL